MPRSLRPARADDLGLRRALSDRLLPLLVAAMTFLAALALAGAVAASGLARHWRGGAASLITVQVPDPLAAAQAGGSRGDAVARALAAEPIVSNARMLSAGEVAALLRPWLGVDTAALSLRLPAVFQVQVRDAVQGAAGLEAALQAAAPGTLVERNASWLGRLTGLAASLRACAAMALLVVAFIAAAVVGLATRAGLAARRDAIEIVHGLGATDRLIAGQFAARITFLVFGGSLLGVLFVLPVLIGLAKLSAPFQGGDAPPLSPQALLATLPAYLWAALAGLPIAAGAIGWSTGQVTVRSWLGRLP
jgi:cell division transport system permease protein